MTRHLLFLSILIAASSCSIEKQLHSKGFHVEFHKRLRPSDPPDAITGRLATKTPETGQIIITADSITDAPILQEKEEIVISEPTNEQIFPTIKSTSGKLKRKSAAGSNKIRTGVSIQTHFSESVMSKSLNENQKKYSAKRSGNFDWGEFAGWVFGIGGLIVLICIGAQAPGVTIGAILLGLLVVVVVIILLALLISSAIGNVEWFWSGR